MEWTLFLIVLCSTAALVIAAEIPGNKCFECNFSPSGYIKESEGWKNAGNAIGYHRCALRQEDDAQEVDKWHCRSGVCFLRRDDNGLVYRGCADENFLPMGINANMSCKSRDQSQSLWWFCTGELCNGGPVTESLHCDTADVISPMYTDDVNEVLDVEDMETNRSPDGKEFEDDAEEGEEEVSSIGVYKEAMEDTYQEVIHQRKELLAALCDGKCEGNPSGLYADPQYSDHFVQCSIGFMEGKQCHCCYPFTRRCPPGTRRFDSFSKVCL